MTRIESVEEDDATTVARARLEEALAAYTLDVGGEAVGPSLGFVSVLFSCVRCRSTLPAYSCILSAQKNRLCMPFARKPWLTVYRAHSGILEFISFILMQ